MNLDNFYHGEIGQPSNEWGSSYYEQWIGPLVPNEIQIYQAISLAS